MGAIVCPLRMLIPWWFGYVATILLLASKEVARTDQHGSNIAMAETKGLIPSIPKSLSQLDLDLAARSYGVSKLGFEEGQTSNRHNFSHKCLFMEFDGDSESP